MPNQSTHRAFGPGRRQTPQEKIHHVARSVVAHGWTHIDEIPWAKYGRSLAANNGWRQRNLVLAEVARLRGKQEGEQHG